MKAARVLRSILLTLTSIIGLVSVISVLAGLLFGIRLYVVQTGSMEPGIPTGSVIVVRAQSAADTQVGDIVTVPRRNGVTMVTHRVVAIEGTGESRTLTLRGDANKADDPYTYTVTALRTHMATIPGAGQTVLWMQSRTGLITIGSIVGAVVLFTFLPLESKRSEDDSTASSQAQTQPS